MTGLAKSIQIPQKPENKLHAENVQESESVKLVKEKIQNLNNEVSSLQDQVKSSNFSTI